MREWNKEHVIVVEACEGKDLEFRARDLDIVLSIEKSQSGDVAPDGLFYFLSTLSVVIFNIL